MTEKSVESGSNEDSDRSYSRQLNRRTLLKGAASTAIGVTGLSAVSGTAAAGGWGRCDYGFPRAPSWFGYADFSGGNLYTHNIPWETDELTIYIHGFLGTKPGALAKGHVVWSKLRDMGYLGGGISCIWDAGNEAVDWWTAQSNTNRVGSALADWLVGSVESHGIGVNLVCHSLGARVALCCLRRLHSTHGRSVDTVHLLGGAVDYQAAGGTFRDDIKNGCNWLHNFYSSNDPMLGGAFPLITRTHAIGYMGSLNANVPANYTDHNCSSEIHQHCEYMHFHAGVLDQVYPHL